MSKSFALIALFQKSSRNVPLKSAKPVCYPHQESSDPRTWKVFRICIFKTRPNNKFGVFAYECFFYLFISPHAFNFIYLGFHDLCVYFLTLKSLSDLGFGSAQGSYFFKNRTNLKPFLCPIQISKWNILEDLN